MGEVTWFCNFLHQHQHNRKVTLLVIGLDNAGKTALVRVIKRACSCDVTPPVDPLRTELRVDRFDITFIDLSGGQRFRAAWRNYYTEAHGIIYVVDSSDAERVEEAKWILASVLCHPKISGKPLLLLANKQDKAGTLLSSELIEALSLEKLVNENKSLCRIEPCAAATDDCNNYDWVILKALRWLLLTIASNYTTLCMRVQLDIAEQQLQQLQEQHKKKEPTRSRARVERELLDTRDKPNEGIAELVEYKPLGANKMRPLQPIHNILSQQKENGLKVPKNKKKKVKLKLKRAVNLASVVEAEERKVDAENRSSVNAGLLHSNRIAQQHDSSLEEQPPLPGPSKKKKKKKKKIAVKNKIKSQEAMSSLPNNDLSSTFDLYRKAMLTLKLRQQQRKQPADTTP